MLPAALPLTSGEASFGGTWTNKYIIPYIYIYIHTYIHVCIQISLSLYIYIYYSKRKHKTHSGSPWTNRSA